MRTANGDIDWSKLLNVVQALVITIMVPFTVYYVNNHTPYMQDKRYIETRFDEHERKLTRIITVLDRLTLLEMQKAQQNR